MLPFENSEHTILKKMNINLKIALEHCELYEINCAEIQQLSSFLPISPVFLLFSSHIVTVNSRFIVKLH